MLIDQQSCVSVQGAGMVSTSQAQQQLISAGVDVEGGAGVEMMVMDSLDPTLLQLKTEVSLYGAAQHLM